MIQIEEFSKMERLFAKVLSENSASVEATIRTIESVIPGLHKVIRKDDGKPQLINGELEILTSDANWLSYAIETQGYVASVRT